MFNKNPYKKYIRKTGTTKTYIQKRKGPTRYRRKAFRKFKRKVQKAVYSFAEKKQLVSTYTGVAMTGAAASTSVYHLVRSPSYGIIQGDQGYISKASDSSAGSDMRDGLLIKPLWLQFRLQFAMGINMSSAINGSADSANIIHKQFIDYFELGPARHKSFANLLSDAADFGDNAFNDLPDPNKLRVLNRRRMVISANNPSIIFQRFQRFKPNRRIAYADKDTVTYPIWDTVHMFKYFQGPDYPRSGVVTKTSALNINGYMRLCFVDI